MSQIDSLPSLDVVPHVFELMEAQLTCAVTIHDSDHAPAGLDAESVRLQAAMFGDDFVEDVPQLVGTHLHVFSGELLENPPELFLLIVLVRLLEVERSARRRRG